MRRRVPPLRYWYFTISVLVLLALFPLYTNYKQLAAPIPPGVHIDGVDLSRLKDPAAIQAVLEPPLTEPLGVRFQQTMLVLKPEEVGFTPDFSATIASAGRYLEGFDFVDIAVREAIGLPQQTRNVAIQATLDEARLRTWLQQVSNQFDYPPRPPRVRLPESAIAAVAATPVVTATDIITTTEVLTLPAPIPTPAPIRELTWIPGEPGYQVDIDASAALLRAGFASLHERTVDLALAAESPPPPAMADLAEQLPRVLDTFPAFSGVYVRDLQSGDEAQVDGDAAFSGMTTLKLPLAVAAMERLPAGIAKDDEAAQQVGEWLDRAIGQGDDAAADQLLGWLGEGNVAAGATTLTAFMQRLGMENSYIQGGFTAAPLPVIATTANQREKPNTRADSNIQTTPGEIGRLLASIYECTQDTGPLRETFPNTLTPEECSQILFYFTHNELRDFLWRGLPEWDDKWVIHQQGLSLWQHGDVALIWGPTGPYVVSVFLFNPGLVYWDVANGAGVDLSRMIWEFFEFRRAEGAPVAGDPPELAPPPGYKQIDTYFPSAANPNGE
jgi:hypothetical protein